MYVKYTIQAHGHGQWTHSNRKTVFRPFSTIDNYTVTIGTGFMDYKLNMENVIHIFEGNRSQIMPTD